MITAPFNFVPLSEQVFHPDWANDISHDIPFEDGESGVIDISIIAKSPIFIRDGEDEERFCNHNGEYYIPSSSIKGMIRNVLEIMSFSKMSFFNDDTYSVRDVSSSKGFYMETMKNNTFGGWLKKDGDDYIIEDCGEIGRIKHEEIDKILDIDFASKFRRGEFKDKADDKLALKKYNMLKGHKLKHPFKYYQTSTSNDKRYTLDENSENYGTIVLTGQSSGRLEKGKDSSGKVWEFIFFDSKQNIKLDKEVVDKFLFAYFDNRTTEPKESQDWTFWKEKLNNNEKVPVFFQKTGDKINHFGLSYLYKLPYTYSVKDGIPKSHIDDDLDMTQAIFGYANEDDALKSRIAFSHFKAISNIEELNKQSVILGTPRASYYPMYVKQEDGKLYKTFMDNGFSVAGRKRYPIHKSSKIQSTGDTGNENIKTHFRPLKEGVVFKGKLRYHNLKKLELGSILSALSFHNTSNTYHSIGLAKSLGCGKIEVKINNMEDIASYLKEFELKMTEQIPSWNQSEQLQELLTMATEQDNKGDSLLKYMELQAFGKAKTNKEFLDKYSFLDNIKTIKVKSLLSNNDLASIKQIQEYYKQQGILKIEAQKKKEEEEKMAKAQKIKDEIAENKQKEKEKKEEQAQNNINIEKQKELEINQAKQEKAQGLNALKDCQDFKEAMSIINNSIGKKADKEQIIIIQEFYAKCKDSKTKKIEKFFKKYQ